MPDSQSIADLLRESVANAPAAQPLDVQLPMFDPPLYVSLRKVKDLHEATDVMEGVEQIRDETSRALEIAARTLVAACTGTFVLVDGQRHDLGAKLGLELYRLIYPDTAAEVAPQSDVQAVLALYTDADGECDEVALVQAAEAYGEWRQGNQSAALESLVGES